MHEIRGHVSAAGVLLGVWLLPFALNFIRMCLYSVEHDDGRDHGGDGVHSAQGDDDDDDNGGDGNDTRVIEDHDVGATELAGDNAGDHVFFEMWLDPRMLLSSARFDDDDDDGVDLTIAQQHMLDSIAANLDLQQGMRVLIVECGWGGCARYLATAFGVHVTGYSRDRERIAVASHLAGVEPGHVARAENGTGTVRFIHGDVNDTFHRIIRISLMEAETPVDEYLIFNLLDSGGKALVHQATSPPRLVPAVVRRPSNRFIVDREDITASFTRTVRFWSDNLDAQDRQGQLQLFAAWTRVWQQLLTSWSNELAAGRKVLHQVVYTKLRSKAAAGKGHAQGHDVEAHGDDHEALPAAQQTSIQGS